MTEYLLMRALNLFRLLVCFLVCLRLQDETVEGYKGGTPAETALAISILCVVYCC